MQKSIRVFIFSILLISSLATRAQVGDIKSASSSHSSGAGPRGGGEGSGQGGALMFDILFNVFFGEVIRAQQNMLERRHEVPGMVSFEAMVHAAVQPSGYYLVHPRARVNWGLFSSDFRFNYLIEEGIDEVVHIRTNDWQILQLNLVTTRNVVGRVGAGIMRESFSGNKTFGEWTGALQAHPHTTRLGGLFEYRGSEVRREVSAFGQYRVFERGAAHGFATGGAVYQKYYDRVTVWGIQGGLLFKFY
ncbi:MAG TPA: hypothetical protein VEB86_18315 [Chryseosolibacter sp.]|nr:hypothetical protein [Chryseosolibacter sp.]